MIKNFLRTLIAIVFLAGCEDRFTGPSEEPAVALGNRVLYTRLESEWMFYGVPAGSIVRRDLGSNFESVVVSGPAYLLCPPQNGWMVYAQLEEFEISDSLSQWIWILKLGSVDGLYSENITTFGGLSSVLIQDVALSHDGRTVAYAVVESPPLYYNWLTEKIYLYKKGSAAPQVIDSVKSTASQGGGVIFVTSLLSQLVFSPDDQYLAAAFWGQNRSVRAYTVATPDDRRLLGSRTGPFVAWSPDSRKLLYSQNSGIYTIEPILSMAEGMPPVEYKVGFPSSSSLVVVDMSNSSTTLLSGLPPVFDVAWSGDGTQIAYSQLRTRGSLTSGTDIIVFRYDTPLQRDTLTAETTSPMTRTRLQWSGDSRRLLFTQGYYSSDYSPYSSLASEIGCLHMETMSGTILDRGAFGVYWLDATATALCRQDKPHHTDSLYSTAGRD